MSFWTTTKTCSNNSSSNSSNIARKTCSILFFFFSFLNKERFRPLRRRLVVHNTIPPTPTFGAKNHQFHKVLIKMFRTTLTQSTTNFQRLHQNVLHKALLITPTSSGAMMMLSGNYTTHIRALSGMSASSSSESSTTTGFGKSVPSSVSFSSSSRHVRGVISSSTSPKNHHHHPLRSTTTTSARASVSSSSSIVRFNTTTATRSNVIQSISLKDDCNNRSKGTTRRSNNSIRLLATELSLIHI